MNSLQFDLKMTFLRHFSNCTPSVMTWFIINKPTGTNKKSLFLFFIKRLFSVTSKKHCLIQNRNRTNSNNNSWETGVPAVSISIRRWRKLWSLSWYFNSFNRFIFGKSFKIFHFNFEIDCEALRAKRTQEFWPKTSKTVEEKALPKAKYHKK